jgi:hypothetical protein
MVADGKEVPYLGFLSGIFMMLVLQMLLRQRMLCAGLLKSLGYQLPIKAEYFT